MMIAEPTLAISREKVCSFIAKTREVALTDAGNDPGIRSIADGEAAAEVLQFHSDSPTLEQLASFIETLTEDERIDLVVLAWLGRGDGTVGELKDLREEADYFHNNRAARYLLAKPMLLDHLIEGLAQLGCDCEVIYDDKRDQRASWERLFNLPGKARR